MLGSAKKNAGTAASNTTLKISPAVLTFGSIPTGTLFSEQNVSILNTASTSIYISNMTLSDTTSNLTPSKYFSTTSGTCSSTSPLAAGGICTFVIRLTPPTTLGNISASGTVSYGAAMNDQPFSTTLNISGIISAASSTTINGVAGSSTTVVNTVQIYGPPLTSSSQTVLATTAITPIDINVTSTGNDMDSHGGAMTYACTFNLGTPCSGLPNIAYSFNTATGILN